MEMINALDQINSQETYFQFQTPYLKRATILIQTGNTVAGKN
jgi:hypothetical protein